MSVVAIAAVVTAGTAAYGAYSAYDSKKKSEAAAKTAVTGPGASAAFGKVPEAARYVPLNFGEEQVKAVQRNYQALPDIGNLVMAGNAYGDQDLMRRANRTIPNFRTAMKQYGAAGNDLLNARLPFSDVMDIVSNGNELRSSIGTPGGGTNATLKDLGLSQLSAVQAGGGILKDMVNIAESVNPVGRRSKPADFYMNPTDSVRLGMEQNQLIQQSKQNENNLAAAGDPAAYAALQMQLAQAGAHAGGAGVQPVGAYGDAASKLITGLAGAFGGGGGQIPATGWGGYTGMPTSQATNPLYFNNRPAYYNGTVVPRASALALAA